MQNSENNTFVDFLLWKVWYMYMYKKLNQLNSLHHNPLTTPTIINHDQISDTSLANSFLAQSCNLIWACKPVSSAPHLPQPLSHHSPSPQRPGNPLLRLPLSNPGTSIVFARVDPDFVTVPLAYAQANSLYKIHFGPHTGFFHSSKLYDFYQSITPRYLPLHFKCHCIIVSAAL